MKELELYNILTLGNDEKYTIVSKTTKDNKEYAMLVMVDDDENPIPEKVKIVEVIDNGTSVKEVDDKKTLELVALELTKNALDELDEE